MDPITTHVHEVIEKLLVLNSKKTECEQLNMLFLLWNFAMLCSFVGETYHMLNIVYMLAASLTFDIYDELFMMITKQIKRKPNYFVKKTAEDTIPELTNRLYSNGIEALVYGDNKRLKSILTDYSDEVIVASYELLQMKPIFTADIEVIIYFILHLILLVFEHGRNYPKNISWKIDKALKAVAEVIVYYVQPFMKRYNRIGIEKMARLDMRENEIILECGEVAAILLKTNIAVSHECRSSLNEFTFALHNVCSVRFDKLGKMYIGKPYNWFSLYHTTLLHGLFVMNYKNMNNYIYNIVN